MQARALSSFILLQYAILAKLNSFFSCISKSKWSCISINYLEERVVRLKGTSGSACEVTSVLALPWLLEPRPYPRSVGVQSGRNRCATDVHRLGRVIEPAFHLYLQVIYSFFSPKTRRLLSRLHGVEVCVLASLTPRSGLTFFGVSGVKSWFGLPSGASLGQWWRRKF